MKLILIISLLSLIACGKSGGSGSTGALPVVAPTPAPSIFSGIWKFSTTSDVIVFNNDGTGTRINCSWSFTWTQGTNPTEIAAIGPYLDIRLTSQPVDNNDEDPCYTNNAPEIFVSFGWTTEYTLLFLNFNQGWAASYAKQ